MLILHTILTCNGIPPKEKNGALIKNDEIRNEATKRLLDTGIS